MAITFECGGCGKSYTVGDNLAGKAGACKQCGRKMTVPRPPSVPDPYGFDSADLEEADDHEPAPLLPRRTASDRSAGSSPGKSPLVAIAGGVGVLVVLALVGLLASNRRGPARGDDAREVARSGAVAPVPVAGRPAPSDPSPATNPVAIQKPAPKANRIAVPTFPDPGPAREVEPGITFQVVDLGPYRPGTPPGSSGKIWLYLPSGEHAAKSLPCVLISGTGSNLVTGRGLLESDRPEHLPYARAGFAVMAFESEGMLADPSQFTTDELNDAVDRFRAAKAGLVNARVAFEYAATKVRAVDPRRISVAGLSTGGTLALLYAEFESRLQACVAYAPINDVEAFFLRIKGAPYVAELKASGLEIFFGRLSPRNNEATLLCPLFLFYAQASGAAADLAPFAARLKADGKPITVLTVPEGGDPVLYQQGIPAAIAWLKKQPAAPDP